MTVSLDDPELLHSIPLFKSLSDDDLLDIINSPENGIEDYDQREIIVREAEVGDCMYIVLDGFVEVTIRSSSSDREVGIATLRPGCCPVDLAEEMLVSGRFMGQKFFASIKNTYS